MIATDPPYHVKHKHLYQWLGSEAYRLLKPGGFAAVMCGGYGLDVDMRYLTAKLDLYYPFQIYMSGSQTGQVWPNGHNRPVITRHKHMLVLQKPLKGVGAYSVMYNPVVMGPVDKAHHEWGQDVFTFKQFIEAFSRPNDLVLDPFSGGGTTAVACLNTTDKHGKLAPRRWLLMECDHASVVHSRERIMGKHIPPMMRMLPQYQQAQYIT